MTDKIEQNIEDFRSFFTKEAEFILDLDIAEEEKQILKKYIDNTEKLSQEEEDKFLQILQDYRGIKNEINPDKIIKDTEKAIELIESEQELLEYVKERNKAHEFTILLDGVKKITFEVLPLSDANVLADVQYHLDIYTDYSQEDLKIFQKGEKNKKLRKREEKIYNKVKKDIAKRVVEKKGYVVEKLLINQIRIKGSKTDDIELRKQIFEGFTISEKAAIFDRIEPYLGIDAIDEKKFFL